MTGRNDPCQRALCVSVPDHPGAAHLDPTSELYDGPYTSIGALNHAPHRAAYTLLHLLSDDDGAMSVQARVALHDLIEEIHRLTRQVAAVRVDMDRQVRAAMQAAESCEHHGKTITELESQVDLFARQSEQNNNGRLALISGIHQIEDLLRVLQERATAGQELPTTTTLVDNLTRYTAKIRAAHMRAWKK